MTAIHQTINTRKAIGNKTNTPLADSLPSSSRPAQRFHEVTQKVISRSCATPTAAHSPRCTPVLQSGGDRCGSVASTAGRQPTHDRKVYFSKDESAMSNTHPSVANSRSARRSPHLKFLQATEASADQKIANPPQNSKVARAHNDKPLPQILTRTSSQMSHVQVAAASETARRNTKDGTVQDRNLAASNKKSANQLCKDCKTSSMESVCFINNDGKITAVTTGAMHARSLHYCSRPGCAAYRRSHRSNLTSSTKSLSKKQVRLDLQQSHTKTQLQSQAEIEDRLSVCSSASHVSIQNIAHDVGKSKSHRRIRTEACTATARTFEGVDEHQTLPTAIGLDSESGRVPYHHITVKDSSSRDEDVRLDGLSPSRSEDQPCSPPLPQKQQCCDEKGVLVENRNFQPAASCATSDVGDQDDKDVMGFVNMDIIDELHRFKSLCYQGDNEYSCSEDGTDVTNTPNSLITGAFDDASNLYADQEHSEDKLSQQRRSSVAAMRRRYLESLAEQEAERVRLRKQEIMARKQAEDWMLDCHMEELLHKLAPNGEARVKVLVEAFEQVIHYSDSEGSQANHQELHNQGYDEQDPLQEGIHTDHSMS